MKGIQLCLDLTLIAQPIKMKEFWVVVIAIFVHVLISFQALNVKPLGLQASGYKKSWILIG